MILLTGGKGPNDNTIQIRKNKTMNADKTYKVREIFTTHYCEIAIAGAAVKNYDEEGRTYNFYCPVREVHGTRHGFVSGNVSEEDKDFVDVRSILEKAEEYNLVVGWD